MKKFIAGKFERYDNPNGIDGGIYLKDADGNDWYEYRNQYRDKGVAVAFDDTGLIKGFNVDITYIFPDDMYFTLVDPQDVPVDMAFDGKSAYKGFWIFDTKKMVIASYVPPHDQLVADAEQKKQQLLQEAYIQIMPLQFAVNAGVATDDEKKQFEEWQQYVIALNRIDVSLAPDIVWPEKPQQ